jgi:hypothetical protein
MQMIHALNLYSNHTLIAFICFLATPLSGKGKTIVENPEATEQSEQINDGVDLKTLAIGASLNSPEIVALEGIFSFSRSWALKFFVAPPLTFGLSIDLPALDIAGNNNFKVQTVPQSVPVDLVYGPHIGSELLLYPFDSAFFVSAGVSYRTVNATMDDDLPIRVCSSTSTVCSSDSASRASLRMESKIETTAMSARAAVGWHWKFRNWYLSLPIGFVVPVVTNRSAQVDSHLSTDLAPSIDAFVRSALKSVQDEEEEAAESQIKAELELYDTLPLPMFGLAIGLQF